MQKRLKKLSIENKSRASSRKSNRSDSKKSGHLSIGDSHEFSLPFGKLEQRSTPHQVNQNKFIVSRRKTKEQKRQVIDSFLKEFGIGQAVG